VSGPCPEKPPNGGRLRREKPKGIARYTLLRKDVPGGLPPGPPKGSWTHVQNGPARAELKKTPRKEWTIF